MAGRRSHSAAAVEAAIEALTAPGRLEEAERLAADAGHDWAALPADHQLSFYAQARLNVP